MTIDQFIEKLRQTPRDWRPVITDRGTLRRGTRKTYQCPLGSVAYPNPREAACGEPYRYGRELGLSLEDTKLIFDAADGIFGCDPTLRRRLIEACGLA